MPLVNAYHGWIQDFRNSGDVKVFEMSRNFIIFRQQKCYFQYFGGSFKRHFKIITKVSL